MSYCPCFQFLSVIRGKEAGSGSRLSVWFLRGMSTYKGLKGQTCENFFHISYFFKLILRIRITWAVEYKWTFLKVFNFMKLFFKALFQFILLAMKELGFTCTPCQHWILADKKSLSLFYLHLFGVLMIISISMSSLYRKDTN